MLSINDFQNGIIVKIGSDPYAVLSVRHLHMGRGGSSVQTKIKNLRTGQVLERNFKPADEFEEAEVEKIPCVFLYSNRGTRPQTPERSDGGREYWFNEAGKAKKRFNLKADDLGDSAQFLKPNLEVTALKFEGKIMGVELPIKVDYKIVEAPPTLRGNTAQGGTKLVVIETGAKIATPLFINEGDIIRVNTSTGEYVERIEKA